MLLLLRESLILIDQLFVDQILVIMEMKKKILPSIKDLLPAWLALRISYSFFFLLTLTVSSKSFENCKVYKVPEGELIENCQGKFPELNQNKIRSLVLLGKIWGFLKYYHPAVASGKYDWDQELFRILPDYLELNNKEERNSFLLHWIKGLGKVSGKRISEKNSSDPFIRSDFKWLLKGDISSDLKKLLLEIYYHHWQGQQYYVKLFQGVNNPTFSNEKAYEKIPFPPVEYRLLALFRYWNIINYFYPYRELGASDWNKALIKHLPKFINAADELEYELAVIQLVADIHDTHANLWGGSDKIVEKRGRFFPPFHLRYIENKVIVSNYYSYELSEKSGLKIGDVILKINGKPVAAIIDSLRPFYPASNEASRMRDISADLLLSNDKEVKLEFTSGKNLKHAIVPLYNPNMLDLFVWYKKDGEKYKLIDNNIGYINDGAIKKEDVIPVITSFMNKQESL